MVKAIAVPEVDDNGEVGGDYFEIEYDRTNTGFNLNDVATILQRAYDDEHDDGKVVDGIYTRNHQSDVGQILIGGTFIDRPDDYEAPRSRLQSAESPVDAAQELQKQAEIARADEPSQYSAGDQAEFPDADGDGRNDDTESTEEDSGGDAADGDYDPTEATVEEIKTWAAQETSRSALNRALRKERAGQGRVTAIEAMEQARDAAEQGS